jgi:hypothetical protein
MLFKRQIDILLFIRFVGFPMNRILCLLFSTHNSIIAQYRNTETHKHKRKEQIIWRFFICGLCEISSKIFK